MPGTKQELPPDKPIQVDDTCLYVKPLAVAKHNQAIAGDFGSDTRHFGPE